MDERTKEEGESGFSRLREKKDGQDDRPDVPCPCSFGDSSASCYLCVGATGGWGRCATCESGQERRSLTGGVSFIPQHRSL